MKIISSFTLTFALCLLVLSSAAAAQERWKRIESNDKEISFALPPDFLFNKMRNQMDDVNSFAAFASGTSVSINVSDPPDPKSNLGRVFIDQARNPAVLDFEVEGVRGRSVTYTDRGYEHNMFLASNKGYYVVRLSSASKDDPVAGRFLRSLRVKGNAMFKGPVMPGEAEDDAVSIRSLKASAEVEKALDRKRPKWDGKLTFKTLAEFTPCGLDLSVAPPFVLSRLSPENLGAAAAFGTQGGTLKINVTLLASGGVGDIIVFSDVERSVSRAFADSAKKMRFVPANRAGTAVDHCETFTMNFGVTSRVVTF
jgi:hypothetical protein